MIFKIFRHFFAFSSWQDTLADIAFGLQKAKKCSEFSRISWTNELKTQGITVRHNCFESFAKKVLENLIGYRAMSPKELSEAKILHQKLWVVHASIRNDAQADEHYEMAYSLQLLDHPKNFDVQQRYVKILEKENISREEMLELLQLYQLGLSESKLSFFTPELTKKVKECQAFLSSSQEIYPNTLAPCEWKQRKKEES